MIRELRIYPSYKPSGVDWLGDVPSHWEVRRLKSICRFTYGDSLPAGARKNENIPVYGSNGKVGFHSSSNASGPCLIIGRKGSFGKVHYSSDPAFAIDTTFFVDQRFTDTNIRWLYYLLLSLNLDAVSKDSAVPGLSREDAYRQIGLCPPPAEQRAIARYLDHVDRRIQRYIEAKEKSIALLQEARQATIHRAVTRGLDPGVPLKPSGVEWLGDVPAHWEVTVTKRHYAIQLGKMLQSVPKRPDDVEVPYLKALHVQWFDVLTSDVPTMWASHRETRQFGIEPGDLLVCEGGEGGRCAILNEQIDNCIIQNALHRVRPREHSLNVYLQYVMSTVAAIGWFDAINDKATIAHFTKEKFDALRIPLPPLTEQRAIVAHLDKTTAAIDAAIDNARRQVERMTEYRASLIAHVVTGKVDVRAAAASLSPEPAEQESVGRSPVS